MRTLDFLSVATVLAITFSACTVPGMTAMVVLPELPAEYRTTHWVVRWWDGKRVRETSHAVPPDGTARVVHLPLDCAGASLPVVAALPAGGPGGHIPLAPYGGWIRAGERAIIPDRHGGELAGILLALAGHGVDPATLNVTRLDDLIRSRVPIHPRRLDHHRLAKALGEREMRSHHVRERPAPLHQVRLPREATAGAWTGDDPAESPYQPAPAGDYELFSVPVMDGEVRRLWRQCHAGGCHHVLLVHRTPAGNSFHRIMTVISPRS